MENYRTMIRRVLLTLLLAIASVGMTEAKDVIKERDCVEKAQSIVQRCLKGEEKWKSGRDSLEKYVRIYPDNPELNYLYGLYFYYGARNVKNARYRFVRAIQADNQHHKAKQMMIAVEDTLKNYSSAICYVNEILEAQPYDKGLWQRKISLLRKMNNQVEADELQERMSRIFPNDSDLARKVLGQNQEKWSRLSKRDRQSELARDLELWIESDKTKYANYRDLTSVYQNLGEYEKAIETAKRGLRSATMSGPQKDSLLRKTVGLMTEQGLYNEAISLGKEYQAEALAYQGIAEDARLHDAYEANARLYDKTKNRDALRYLVNTSVSRGYYDDAQTYIRALYGNDSTALLQQQYGLEVRMGHDQAAQSALMKLYRRNPDDPRLREEYIDAFQRLSNSDVANAQWRDAEKDLQELYGLIKDSTQHEYWLSMMVRRMMTYGHLQRFDDVRNTYHEACSKVPEDQKLFAFAHEDIILPRLKAYEEEERYDSALVVAEQLLNDVPTSTTALRHCINLSQTLKKDTLFYQYAQRGYELQVEEPYYITKYATALSQQRQYDNALELLEKHSRDRAYVNPSIINTHSGVTLDLLNDTTVKVSQDKETMRRYVDRALRYDPLNKELLYYLGVAYEKNHEWDSAHYYQSRYQQPGNAEQREYYQHMDYLQFRSFKERVDVSYTHALFDTRQDDLASTGHLYSIATVTYAHLTGKDTYTGQVSYKGIDGYHEGNLHESGGAGLELMAQWEHQFNSRWSGMVNGSWSNRYFNKFGFNASATYALDHGWTPSLRLGYRRTPETYIYLSSNNRNDVENEKLHLFIATPSVMKEWGERIRTTLTTDMAVIRSGFYYNVGLKGKLFFNDDNISSVSLITGFGSFPELSFFEQTALRNVSHTNSMIGFDAQILCSSRLYVGLSGSWNTCYDPRRDANGVLTDSYRNIYTITAQLHVAF